MAALMGVPASMAEHRAKPFVNYGAKIAEHVEVPEALLRRPGELGEYLARSRAHTDRLPMKGKSRRGNT